MKITPHNIYRLTSLPNHQPDNIVGSARNAFPPERLFSRAGWRAGVWERMALKHSFGARVGAEFLLAAFPSADLKMAGKSALEREEIVKEPIEGHVRLKEMVAGSMEGYGGSSEGHVMSKEMVVGLSEGYVGSKEMVVRSSEGHVKSKEMVVESSEGHVKSKEMVVRSFEGLTACTVVRPGRKVVIVVVV